MGPPAPLAVYGTDLAFIHEDGFSWVAEAAARELRHHIPGGRVVDLGSGGGTLARSLVDAGYAVHGMDVSPPMIALARERVPEATFEVADAGAAAIPAADAVTAVGEVLCYVAASRPLAPLLGRIREALPTGGVFLCDVATLERSTGTTVRGGQGWRVEATTTKEGAKLMRAIDTWRNGRHTHEEHQQRLLEPDAVTVLLEDAGFEVEALGCYDDMMLEAGWESFLATAA